MYYDYCRIRYMFRSTIVNIHELGSIVIYYDVIHLGISKQKQVSKTKFEGAGMKLQIQ